MNRSDPRELISAYLDGEVSPDERTEAERLLEASADLRRDLDDFSRLSELLRALPRESAPPEVAAAIQSRSDEKSLLVPEPVVPRRSLRRELIASLAGAAVTAAAWLLTVRLPDAPFKFDAVAISTAQPEAQAPEMSALTDAALPADAPSRIDRTAASAMTGPADDSLPALPAEAKQFPEASERFAGGLPVGETAWRSVRIGDVVPYFEKNSNGVAVLELTVVDIQQVADQVQYLCARNDIAVLQSEGGPLGDLEARITAQPAKPDPNSDGASTGLVALYVTAPSSNMTQLLDELDEQQNLFVSARLQPPVELPPGDAPHREGTARSSPEADAKATEERLKEEAAILANSYVSKRQMLPDAISQSADLAKTKEKVVRRKDDASAVDGEALRREGNTAAAAPKKLNVSSPADALIVSNSAVPQAAQNYGVLIPLPPQDANVPYAAEATRAARRSVADKTETEKPFFERGFEANETASDAGLVRLLLVLQPAAPSK
jgi:hypothetical protein